MKGKTQCMNKRNGQVKTLGLESGRDTTCRIGTVVRLKERQESMQPLGTDMCSHVKIRRENQSVENTGQYQQHGNARESSVKF